MKGSIGALLLCLFGALLGSPVRGQEPIRLVAPRSLRADLRLAAFLDDLDRSSASGPLRERERGVEEEFEITSEGYAYHPLFLEFNGRAALRLRQYHFEVDRSTYGGETREAITRYNVSLDLLKRRRLGTTMRFTRSLTDLNSNFKRNRTFLMTSQFFRWRPFRGAYPLDLSFTRSSREVRGALENLYRRRSVRGKTSHENGPFRGGVEGDLEWWSQTVPDLTVRGIHLEMRETYGPGEPGRETASLVGRLLRNTGDVAIRDLFGGLAAQSPEWRGFRASSALSATRYRSDGPETRSRRGRLGVSHALYRSLRTSLQYSRRESRQGGAESVSHTFEGGLGYRKRILGGHIGLRFRVERTESDETNEGGRTLSGREEHRVPEELFFFLDQEGVDSASITLTETEGPQTFTEGIDYEVADHGGLVEIRILPAAEIDEGDLLAVRFDYDLGPRLRYRAFGREVSGTLRLWERLTLSAAWDRIDETPLIAPLERLGDIEDVQGGIEFRLGPLATDGSYRDHDESRTSFESWSVGQSLGAHLGGRIRATLGARYGMTHYKERDERSESWRGNGRIVLRSVLGGRITLLVSGYRMLQPRYRNRGYAWGFEWERRFPALLLTVKARRVWDDLELRGTDEITVARIEVTRRFL